MFKFLLYKIGQFIVNHLSLKGAYRFALFFSDLQYFFSPRDRRAVSNNLRIITRGSGDIQVLTREVFRNFGRYLVEFFCIENLITKEYIQERVRAQGLENVDLALKSGRGAIVVTAHIGNWELGGIILSMLGHPVVAIALPHKERPVNDLFNHQREIRGMTVVPTNIAIRRCMETLKENKIVALVADRDFTMHGEEMDFFGLKTLIPRGAALFSLKTGAPIIPTFLIRDKEDRFDLIVHKPIYPATIEEANVLETEKIQNVIRQYLTIIEDTIRNHPDQWLMFREFWIKGKVVPQKDFSISTE